MTGPTLAERVAAVGFEPTSGELDLVGACNLCDSGRSVEVARRDRYGFATTLRVCTGCGLGWLSPRLSGSDYARFYESVYRPLVSAYHDRLIDARTVQAEQRTYAADLVDFLEPVLSPPPATVLDVGGSTGIVAEALRVRFGSAPTVLDPAPDELEVAAAAGMDTIPGFVEDFDPGACRWDLVLLCQTVDHLLDVRTTLAAIRGMMAPGGHAFVDVLDVGFMARRRGSIEGAVKIDHPFYLTRYTALAYFARHGFDVVAERMSDDGHWGFLLALGEPSEPDWTAMKAHADSLLRAVWAQRAAG